MIDQSALLEEVHAQPVAWLYDELDIEEPVTPGCSRVFTHATLLSNGWELGLRFRGVTVHRPVTLLPVASPVPGSGLAVGT